ncbi:MAG: GNAT family N-acetyltransferase [Clostridiales bacterium]|nr:GNAT family N-acetyltransferase [Clostridiales bacterium]MCF8023293.1 GNAT family N-acetyltransferase [Clostridiales bacterium]
MQTRIGGNELYFYPIKDCDYSTYEDFYCNNNNMEAFLKNEAYVSHLKKEASTTLVFIDEELVAYFTLRHNKFEVEGYSKKDCIEIARIAVKESKKSQGIGQSIVNNIINLAYLFNEEYIIAMALTEVVDWYKEKLNFELVEEDEDAEDQITKPIYLNLKFNDILDEYFENP